MNDISTITKIKIKHTKTFQSINKLHDHVVKIPFPPFPLKKHGQICPKQQKRPETTKSNIPSSPENPHFSQKSFDKKTDRIPFKKSPAKTNIAGATPSERKAFENPGLLLPRDRISFFWPTNFDIIIEKFIQPKI